MSIPQSIHSHLHHKLYHDSHQESAADPQHLHQVHRLQARLPSGNCLSIQRVVSPHPSYSYSPVSTSQHIYQHQPSASVQHAKYSTFPSVSKPIQSRQSLRLSRLRPTLLPLIAKFEALDAVSLSTEGNRDVVPKPLKLMKKETQMRTEEGARKRVKQKEKAIGVQERVVGMLEWGSREKKSKDGESPCLLLEEQSKTQHTIEIPFPREATKPTWKIQRNQPLPRPEPESQVLLTKISTWHSLSKRRRESALQPRRESKIRDKIHFFDGNASNSPTKHSSIAHVTNGSASKKRPAEQTVVSRSKAITLPQEQLVNFARLQSKGKMSVQTLPPGYNSSPVRERPWWGEIEERVRSPGNTSFIYRTLETASHVPSTGQLRTARRPTKEATARIDTANYGTKRDITDLNMNFTKDRDTQSSGEDEFSSPQMGLRSPLSKFLQPSLEAIRDSVSPVDGTEIVPNGWKMRPRGKSMVKERTRQLRLDNTTPMNISPPPKLKPGISAAKKSNPVEEKIRHISLENTASKKVSVSKDVTPGISTAANRTPTREEVRQYSFGRAVVKEIPTGKDFSSHILAANEEAPAEEVLQQFDIRSTPKTDISVGASGLSKITDEKDKAPDNLTDVLTPIHQDFSKYDHAKMKERSSESSQLQKRFSNIKSKIRLFENFSSTKLVYTVSKKDLKAGIEIDAEKELKRLFIKRVTSDFGAPLTLTRRVSSPTPTTVLRDGYGADKVMSRGKAKLKRWWNEGREAVPVLNSSKQDKRPSEATTLKTRAREERTNRRAVRASPQKLQTRPKEKESDKRRDSGIEIANNTHKYDSSDETLDRLTCITDRSALTISPVLFKQARIHTNSLSTSGSDESRSLGSSMVVEMSVGDDTPISMLKLVLQKRGMTKRGTAETVGDGENINGGVVDTVVARCELSQPRPRRLLEIQRMVRLCKVFAEREGSWSREISSSSGSGDQGSVDGSKERRKKKLKEKGRNGGV